jgi:two-component system sensor histidine kinase KdpD
MAEPRKGRLTIFLGAAAGVGKTYVMLSEARALRRSGTDVKVGLVETHGRADTAEMVADLPVIPRRQVDYRGSRFEEMDLDAILEDKPQVALVDELAHTNVPGSLHRKRYEDIEQLLDNGIDVWATVNVQHLESLNDLVYELTGVKVRETFPDNILERADDIRLVDISPEALIERIKAGKVYPAGRIEASLANFFRKSNLSALRELALREVAAEVEMEAPAEEARGVAERIMVLVRPDSNAQRLLRAGWRMARRLNAELLVVYIKGHKRATSHLPAEEEQERLKGLREISEALEAEFQVVESYAPITGIVDIVKSQRVTQLLMGRPGKIGYRAVMQQPLLLQVMSHLPSLDIHLLAERPAEEEGR